MDLTPDQLTTLEKLGLNPPQTDQTPPKVNLLPLFSISGLTIFSFGGLILFKSANSATSVPVSPVNNQVSMPTPTQVPKSIQHYLLTSQQFFSRALQLQGSPTSTKPSGEGGTNSSEVISLLNQAILTASEAVSTFPTDYRSWEQRGRLYQSLLTTQPQLLPQAIADFSHALQLNPDSASLTRNLASLYAQKGDANQTLTYLQQTITLEPTKAQNFYDLAKLQQQTGLLPQALVTYNRLLTLLTDSTQINQVKAETTSLEKLVAQTDDIRAKNIAPSGPPSPSVDPSQIILPDTPPTIQASTASGLIIAAPETSKSISVTNQTESNSLSGTATIPAGQKQITLTNTLLTSTSQVYLTITQGNSRQTLQLLSKSGSTFTAGFDSPVDTDTSFKWWIIN